MADNKEIFSRTEVSVYLSLKQDVLPSGGDTPRHYLNTGFGPPGPPLQLVVGGLSSLRQRSLSMILMNRIC